MRLCRRILGQTLFERLMKLTFYGQFVAGEDQASILPLIQHNLSFGVGSVLDFGVEDDLSHEQAERQEMDSCTAEAEKDGSGSSQREKQYQPHRAFGDRRDGVISARTYFYANEAKCDQHMETFLQCIETAGHCSENGFSAIKLTALGRPQFLLQFSEVLMRWRKFFQQIAVAQGQGGLTAMDTRLDLKKLQEMLAEMGVATKAESQHWFTGEQLGVSGTVDLLDWNSLIDSRTKISKLLLVPNEQTGQLEPLLSRFTEEEDLQMKRLLQRVNTLAEVGGVESPRGGCPADGRRRADVFPAGHQPPDARNAAQVQHGEASHLQHLPVLPQGHDVHRMPTTTSPWMWSWPAERAGSLEPSWCGEPTWSRSAPGRPRCLDFVLEEIKHNRKANVMVASHNEDTVRFALQRMEKLGLHPSEHKVYFGQLLGMCDQISFPLGQAGFPVYKYVPYGPVNEVLPYLSRRALENRGIMKGAQLERHLLWKELKRRLLAGELFYRPVP
ncbi:proline dehydrogenase 1, mitochondrial isoform X2 [Ornithorhynchus anatinus]|uniref:proline dehydrogenase 1, mitochondrial isoform X2 n=1 Tax=Ornithorhynchus anatinus TaxID=9258 RepID=UPI0010A87056|nr:proline dehydrogenase 1, mitochondrial isoform X2 [Ornithorhynchus anatinus]